MKRKESLANKVKWKLVKLSHRLYKLPRIDYSKKIAYVLNVSNHPNAGDQEITLAQKKFIAKYLPGFLYVEIEKEKTEFIIDELASKLKKEDIVFIQGGGTMSDLYPEHELPRVLLLKGLANAPCKIIQFPVSAYFEDLEEFSRNKQCYEENSNLSIFARESKSFDFLKSNLKVPVFHVPDIVLSQDESRNNRRGEDIIIMFRSDQECLLSKELANDIINYFSNQGKLTVTDNYVEDYVPTFEKNREELLNKKFDEFRNAKLVITDRLHGMIFAYITKTPAIVFDNSYGKVSFSYKNWLEGCTYVSYLEAEKITLADVISASEAVLNSERDFCFKVDDVFEPLINIIK
ncbi:TPA: polysaccharide pyruvyl transferase family protein [Klebsiella pneumoniae]|nr:polysaccharide pyruvyl transferase family protein [Klebsiella pneumoniae]